MTSKFKIVVVMCLIPLSFAFQTVIAQTKTATELEELKLQQEIDAQKKAMVEMNKAIEIQNSIPEVPLPPQTNTPTSRRSVDSYDIRNSGFQGSGTYDFTQVTDHYAAGRTTWDFSKSVTESTFSKEYGIDVEKGSRDVSLTISGTCKSGEIRISILMPGGKPYSEAVIDEFGNLNWRKSFQIAEDNTDKIGEWKFKVSSKNATGNFNIALRVN